MRKWEIRRWFRLARFGGWRRRWDIEIFLDDWKRLFSNSKMSKKFVLFFPYLGLDRIIKMGDFEIHPFQRRILTNEFSKDERDALSDFASSFRKTFFEKSKIPEKADWIWILKFRWTFLRGGDDYGQIRDNVKILILLLKLHINHDFLNPWLNHINIKSFDEFPFDAKGEGALKFWNWHHCDQLYSTIPEGVAWLSSIKFYPLSFCTNNIPVELKIFGGWDEIFWIDSKVIDLTDIFVRIKLDKAYYERFLRLANVHYWLMRQDDVFFYSSIVPSIVEVLNPPKWPKKLSGVKYWMELDKLIFHNDVRPVSHGNETLNLGLIARTIFLLYDTRNALLHEWEKTFDKLGVPFHSTELKVYEVFQLIFKYTVLSDLIQNGIIQNSFSRLCFKGSIITSGEISISCEQGLKLFMDDELQWLVNSSTKK